MVQHQSCIDRHEVVDAVVQEQQRQRPVDLVDPLDGVVMDAEFVQQAVPVGVDGVAPEHHGDALMLPTTSIGAVGSESHGYVVGLLCAPLEEEEEESRLFRLSTSSASVAALSARQQTERMHRAAMRGE